MAKLQSKKTRLHNINVSKWILRVDLIQKPFGKSSPLRKTKCIPTVYTWQRLLFRKGMKIAYIQSKSYTEFWFVSDWVIYKFTDKK